LFQKFAKIFRSQGAPPASTTPAANCCRCQLHRLHICHWYQRHRRQIYPPVPLVLLPPVVHLDFEYLHKYSKKFEMKYLYNVSLISHSFLLVAPFKLDYYSLHHHQLSLFLLLVGAISSVLFKIRCFINRFSFCATVILFS
jgi:hypothetical protein